MADLIMPYVLIAITSAGTYSYPTLAMQEFNNFAACQNARREIRESPLMATATTRVTLHCVPKGYPAPTGTQEGQ